ncbi:MAG: ABC transporter permease, partial [Gemmatimonadetes bacterium]|nr:ABC transporter permease [Gemmatimonadota bacterium]
MNAFEGVGIALDSIRASKGRAALTILGVAIGVAVVMIIASVITGINRGVTDMVEQLGPRTFFLVRSFEGGIDVSDEERLARRRRPRLTVDEANRIAQLASIEFAVVSEYAGSRIEFENRNLESVTTAGQGPEWLSVSGGDISTGRTFTRVEAETGSLVAVVNQKLADELFGRRDPIGKRIKIAGVPYRVIGLYTPAPSLFGEDDGPQVTIPHNTFDKHIPHWRGSSVTLALSPTDDVTVQTAMDDVAGALRGMRAMKPGIPNNFDLVTQDKLLEIWQDITGMFFLVMMGLSSIGLLVGGVGVVAIMMISVTERTREIG